MIHQKFIRLCAVLSCFAAVISAQAQFTITGVADKTTYNDSVTLTIGTQAGYNYNSTLNWKPVVTGVGVVVNKPDFYELRVDATNTTTSVVTSQYLRFTVKASERVDTEWGLPAHVPFPVIQSSPDEFVGARLRVLTPPNFPTGYEIPVVAWVVDEDNHAVRANGLLAAAGQNSIQLKRGTGSGFLASNQPAGMLNYTPSIGGISSNKPINLEAGTVWTSVAGTLSGATTWPDHSRIRVSGNLAIPVGSSLTIGAGSIVLLNSGVNITNDGAVVINGSVEQPVVFMPNSRSQPWGGFFMRNSSSSINATGAIFVASGAAQSGAPGHRPEQCLFLVDNSPSILLSDSAAIYLAGQFGHAYSGGTFTFNRFLMQRATTGGEYTGASFTVNDSAFIECPDDSVNFVDGDNDALYFVSGSHYFTNTLIGWTKDDGIDSGGSGYGPLTYQSCWFEATFHEGNSLSGYKDVFSRDTVYFDCGQGIEDGYNAPTGRLDNCFFSMCESGIRHGDNYPSIGNYDGRFTATNCISIYNHRDIFGFNWHNPGGWTNSYDRFWTSNNFVSALDTNYPNNALWNPATDAWRLGSLGGVGRVGVGFGVRGSSLPQFPNGIPVGLSRFCTNEVRVDYSIDGTEGTHATGTLVFPAGLTRNYIPAPTNVNGVLRIALLNPVNADITASEKTLFQNLPAGPGVTNVSLISTGATWKYLDDGSNQGVLWRGLGFNDSTWLNGVAELGFGDSPRDEATIIRRTNTVTGSTNITFYFRRSITVTDPTLYSVLALTLKYDDGGVVYINSNEVFRVNLPAGAINYLTLSPATAENSFASTNLSATLLQPGLNQIAVEIHQQSTGSSDVTFDLSLMGIPGSPARVNITRLGSDVILYWTDSTFSLEQSPDANNGTWTPAGSISPVGVAPADQRRIYRLRR